MSDKDIRDEILERAIAIKFANGAKIVPAAEGKCFALRPIIVGGGSIERKSFESLKEAYAWIMEERDGR